jgi:hypothetical protein
LVSLGEREMEPRWEPNRLAKVSPAKEERRPLRGGEGEGGMLLLFSSVMVVRAVKQLLWLVKGGVS